MARMPGAQWLGEHSPRRKMDRWDLVCIHTIVGYAPAHEAHFSVHADGDIDQSRDTAYRSAANLDGNHRIIAVENEDHGPPFPRWSGSNVPPLTEAQINANARILAFAHVEHGVPLQLAPDSQPRSRGLCYHRQGIDGNFGSYRYGGRVSGGEVWTKSRGKVCPGDARIAQVPLILARAKAIVNGEEPRPAMNTVEQAHVEFAKGFRHLRNGITKLRDAKKGRRVVATVERAMTAQYHLLAALYRRLPKS